MEQLAQKYIYRDHLVIFTLQYDAPNLNYNACYTRLEHSANILYIYGSQKELPFLQNRGTKQQLTLAKIELLYVLQAHCPQHQHMCAIIFFSYNSPVVVMKPINKAQTANNYRSKFFQQLFRSTKLDIINSLDWNSSLLSMWLGFSFLLLQKQQPFIENPLLPKITVFLCLLDNKAYI